MHFDSPFALLLLGLLPFLLDLPLGDRANSRTSEPMGLGFATPVLFRKLPRSKRVVERRRVLMSLRAIAFVSLVVALARPQTSVSFNEVEESGRDIMLTLDISGSMKALDFYIDSKRVDRLTALKSVVSEFILKRKGDRLGLVIFGSDVFTQCPLTMDYRVLIEFVAGLEIGMVGEGTALGDGIGIAVKRLKEIPGNSKVIVLVTDGVKTAGTLEPREAADIAAREGIKIHTIGIGGNKPAPFPAQDIFGRATFDYRPVELDEQTLIEVAKVTGGQYFNAEKTEALQGVYAEISALEERTEKSTAFTEYEEHFLPFVLSGLVCVFLAELLCATRYLVVS